MSNRLISISEKSFIQNGRNYYLCIKLYEMKKLLILSLVVAFLSSCSTDKSAWMDGQKVYDGYALTKKRQEEFLIQRDSKQAILDSLRNNIIALENNLRAKAKPSDSEMKKYEDLVRAYQNQNDNFQKENAELSDKFRAELIGKIQEKVKEYGKANGYQFIHGDWESGNLMYARESDDITEEIIKYLNE